MMVCFEAKRPSIFRCNIHSDSPMARKLLAGWSGSLSGHQPGSNLRLLLVACVGTGNEDVVRARY